MNESKINFFKKLVASVCHYCPFCIYGRKNPDSIIGKILHHRLHADYCPFWKAEKEVYQDAKGINF